MQHSDLERSRRYDLIGQLLTERGAEQLLLPVERQHRARVSFLAGTALSATTGLVAFSTDRRARLLMRAFDERPSDAGWLEVGDLDRHMADLDHRRTLGAANTHPGPTDEIWSALDELRSVKSAEELRAVEESAWILDAVFEHILEFAEPGRPMRQVSATIHQRALELGAGALRARVHRAVTHDPDEDPRMVLASDTLGDAVIRVGEPLNISVDIAGPTGYWTRLARTIALTELEIAEEAAARAASAGLAAICRHLKPGLPASEAVRIAHLAAVDEGGSLQTLSITGTGLAPTEPPMLLATDASPVAGNVVTVQVQAVSPDGSAVSLQSDTLIMERDVARRLSRLPIGVLHTLHRDQMGRTGQR